MDVALEFVSGNLLTIISLITAIVAVCNYRQSVKVHKMAQRQKEYENYHSLIDRLNIPRTQDGRPFLDMQKSAVYEMRNYPRYKDLTYEILKEWIPRDHGLSAVARGTLEKLRMPYNE